jgi:hypothetical protein
MQLETGTADGFPGRLTSSNDDVDLEVMSVGHSVVKRKGATFIVLHTVTRQLLLPLSHTIGLVGAVVLRVDDDASLLISQVGDDITPTLVVVDAQRNDEVLAGVGHETKGARRSATAHSEYLGSVSFAPCSAISKIPGGPLDDAEECILLGLGDLCGDIVSHSRRIS